jgi:mannobiose 2-epimerase
MNAASTLRAVADEARGELLRVTDWWLRHSVDHARGGFFGEIDARNASRANADKAVVLNTRLLWFLSEAGAHLGSAACLALADRAAGYVGEHFADARRGGLYWMLDAEGRPIDQRKQAYAQAFGAYAFTAHHAASGNRASLDQALALFDVLETHFLDRAHGGYWEARAEDFASIEDMRLSPRDLNAPKSMNTHLHVLEGYTALYRVAPSRAVAAALGRTIRIMSEQVFDERSGRLRLFFDEDWSPISDTASFGHDIEASWLLCEAAEALGDAELLDLARSRALALADITLAEAIGPNGELFEEYDARGGVSQRRVWWIQAEGLVGFLNAFELTGDTRFLDACLSLWRFIQRHQLDLGGGEWRELSTLDAPAPPVLRGGPWKCPYHTGRAMMEMETRARRLAKHIKERLEVDELEGGTTTCSSMRST